MITGQKHRKETLEKMRVASLGNQFAKGNKANRTSFKKGDNLGNTNGFKKGNKPMNGFKKGVKSNYCGEKHPNWKGGINPLNDTIRKSLEVKSWKRNCMERDNFICQKTGQQGGKLVIHHINNFSSFPELRTSLGNGVTLSVEAHKEFHSLYGQRNNNQEQLALFLNK